MLRTITTILFDNISTIVSKFFAKVIDTESELKLYEKQNESILLARIRVGHIFASLVFLSFGVFDYFIIEDKNIFTLITVVRLTIFFFILTPFLLITFTQKILKYLRPAIFITYLLMGGFVVFLSYLLDVNQIAFFHNYLALNCIIICLFIILTYRIIDTVFLVILYVLGYNFVNYLNVSNGAFYINTKFSLSHLIDINVWFISISFVSFLIWRFNENISQQNFVVRNKLRLQKNELEQTNKIKNKFFKIISHDLKNLIGPQFSLSNYLAERHLDLSVEKRDELIKMLENSALNILNVFEELVTWVKAQTSTIIIEPQFLNLNKTIDKTHDLLKPSLVEKEIKLKAEIEDNLIVFCDENSMKTVFRNVIGNAIKFSHYNSVIKINTHKVEDEIIISVTDNGIGMSDLELESLFKLDVGSTQVGTNGEIGTGLGLILSKELIKLNKGRIWIESEEQNGTTVSIALQQNSF